MKLKDVKKQSAKMLASVSLKLGKMSAENAGEAEKYETVLI